MHNPRELPVVDGSWHWLEEADYRRAQALGYETPVEVTVARSRHEFGVGLDTSNVFFRPNLVYVNPDTQPQGQGSWSFLTLGEGSARELAWTNLGRQEDFGFQDVPYPTAQQVWDLRQRLVRSGRDITPLNEIEVVWVPGDEVESSTSEPNTKPEQSVEGSTAPNDLETIDPDVFDEAPPHYRHDLTNGGAHDQTGAVDIHRYRTIQREGKRLTCDVSTAALNRPELHKFWIPNKKGVWRQYPGAAKMDWSSKSDLKHLNSWRDQAFTRGKWPPKRKEDREDYPREQREWLFDIIAKNKGKPPGSKELAGIAAEFNRRYSAQRTNQAISGLCYRLAAAYEKNGGKLDDGPGRGQKKKAEAERKRKAREETGEEPSRKRTHRPKPEDDDEDVVMTDTDSEDEVEEAEGEGDDSEGSPAGTDDEGEEEDDDTDVEG